MAASAPRVRRGAHRPRTHPLRGLVPALAALLALVLVGVGIALYRPGGTARTEPAVDTASPVASGTSAPGSVAAAPPGPPPAPPSPPPPRGTAPAGALQVTVLNATRRQGLGTVAARRLRERGWRVGTITNFRRTTVTATTVYYPAGAEEPARALAASLPVPAQVQQRPENLSSLVRQDRLTVVLAADYPA